MAAPIRSPLTPEQEEIAARLKALWLQRKDRYDLTQVKAAEMLGITQGAFTQYLNNHIAINTDFVLGMCRLLEVDPCDVHRKYGDLVFVRRRRH